MKNQLITSSSQHFATSSLLAISLAALGSSAQAAEYPIGTPHHQHGMEIAAVYLQPVLMEPDGVMRKPEETDIHIEADIHALGDNPNGFAEGDWMPYLVIGYQITKEGGQPVQGEMMPMVASDGPHYGDNVKLDGPGKYHVVYKIAPPTANASAHFGRHTDRLTGVRPWFKPFEVEYDFVYAGIGKKGGY